MVGKEAVPQSSSVEQHHRCRGTVWLMEDNIRCCERELGKYGGFEDTFHSLAVDEK